MQFGVSEAKMTCESYVAVWDNGIRDSMKKEYLVHENFCNWRGGIWMVESTKMTIFGESIHHNQDYGLPSIFREPLNEIHWNICPNPWRGGKRVKQSIKECSFTLVVLTRSTFDNHILNFSLHPLPKEVTSHQLIFFDEPRVPYWRRSMEFLKDHIFKVCALGKHQTTLVSQRIAIPR